MIISPLEAFIFAYLIPAIIVVLVHYDEPDKEHILGAAIFPSLNIIVAIIAIFKFIIRCFESKGKCTLGHQFIIKPNEVPPSQLRLCIGGDDEYHCAKCKAHRCVKWSAF